jgi:hypothetical protein
MRTQKQIAASRENGRKSHGAVTPEGKARIVNANLQSGIFADTHILGWEDQEEFKELKYEYYARHPPASPEARCLLDQIVMCEWHLRRFLEVEGSLWDHLFDASPQGSDGCAYALQQGDQTFTRLQHRINSTRRAFHAAERARTPRSPRPGCRRGQPRLHLARNPFTGNAVTSSWESP